MDMKNRQVIQPPLTNDQRRLSEGGTIVQSPSARGKGGEKKRKTKNKTKARKKVSCQSVSPSGSPLLATGLASGLCRSRLRRRSFQQDKKRTTGVMYVRRCVSSLRPANAGTRMMRAASSEIDDWTSRRSIADCGFVIGSRCCWSRFIQTCLHSISRTRFAQYAQILSCTSTG